MLSFSPEWPSRPNSLPFARASVNHVYAVPPDGRVTLDVPGYRGGCSVYLETSLNDAGTEYLEAPADLGHFHTLSAADFADD
jgi:hypothetical protein